MGRELAARYNKAMDRDKRPESEGKKEKVFPDKLLYLLLDESNYKVVRYLESTELLSVVHSPNHLIFCLQIPESPGAESVLAEYRKEKPDGQIICFPRFFKFPRSLSASFRD